jgi:predicted Holliday junction resolvase-like endonuclease
MTRLLRKEMMLTISPDVWVFLTPSLVILLMVLVVLVIVIRRLDKSTERYVKLQNKYSRELHHRKSSEVRLGKIGENLAPFTEGWPWDANNFRFLGNPVDGVQFNDDEIIFVEIKTGKARLSRSQKDFRDLVKKGKVSFVTFKITDGGTKLVREERKG